MTDLLAPVQSALLHSCMIRLHDFARLLMSIRLQYVQRHPRVRNHLEPAHLAVNSLRLTQIAQPRQLRCI